MIEAATQKLEAWTDLKFITQTWDVFMDAFLSSRNSEPWWDGTKQGAISELVSQANKLTLPIGIGQSLVAFNTYGDDGVPVVHTVGDYIFDAVNNRCSVGLKQGNTWPATILRASNGIQFRVTVGFGAAANVPSDLKIAVMNLAAHMYENRGDQNEMSIPPHVMQMVDQYRSYKVGC